jgi:hypothetical protein
MRGNRNQDLKLIVGQTNLSKVLSGSRKVMVVKFEKVVESI